MVFPPKTKPCSYRCLHFPCWPKYTENITCTFYSIQKHCYAWILRTAEPGALGVILLAPPPVRTARVRAWAFPHPPAAPRRPRAPSVRVLEKVFAVVRVAAELPVRPDAVVALLQHTLAVHAAEARLVKRLVTRAHKLVLVDRLAADKAAAVLRRHGGLPVPAAALALGDRGQGALLPAPDLHAAVLLLQQG